MFSDTKVVRIFTDGACSPNPGPGGYGVIIGQHGKRTELSGGFRKTTNNRMELYSVIMGIQSVSGNNLDVTIHSDSRYVVDMLNGGYAKQWQANNWMRDRQHRAENKDLWGGLLDLCKRHRIKFEWVKSHSDHPENERCDQLAVEARQKDNLPPDEGYEEVVKTESEQTEFDCL